MTVALVLAVGTFALPSLAVGFLVISAAVVGTVIEVNLGRRDAALRRVDELKAASNRRDLADQQRTARESQLRQDQRLDAAGLVAGGVAHDFNNLLAAIMSYADLIADDLGDHPSKPDIGEIRNAARRGARLTRQLLQFGNRTPSADETTDLNSGITDLHPLLARAVGDEIDLRTELAPRLPPVVLAPTDLEQVLTNLVVNARDAIEGAGTISIKTELVAGGEPRVRLLVADSGGGIEAEVAARIFEPFTTKERGRGPGLGLATVYGTVTRAGGTVAVTSVPGRGSTFEVVLRAAPAVPVPAPTSGAELPDDAYSGAGQTILVVEDEDALRKPTRRMLERAGYQVIEAQDGAEAVTQAATARIDVVLTDVCMPGGMTGRELADRLRAPDHELPIVFMSGYAADALARRGGDDNGPTDLLQKPFSEEGLLSAIDTALRSTSAVVNP
jgi:two-component system cell cycle sensor histidine kinase/response regulator CckA